MKKLISLLFGIIVMATMPQTVQAKPFTEADVPEVLKPWIPWVMADSERNPCPFLYNSADARQCVWPGRLTLAVTAQGAEFTQNIAVYQSDPAFVRLPGTSEQWPQEIHTGERSLAVVAKDGFPGIWLTAGQYTITGKFYWDSQPEMLQLPPGIGLTTLSINGEQVGFPDIDDSYQWWIQRKQKTVSGEADSLEIKVYRKLTDSIPLMVETRLMLQVSGKPREALLPKVLLDQQIPVSLDSQLPARLEPDGRLRLQLRPGVWPVTLVTRAPARTEELTLPQDSELAKEEIWALEPQNQLRLVQAEGVPTIDPTQTEMPEEWRSLPAYYLKPGDTMKLIEKKRGYAEAADDQLNLSRQLWLDFDGDGYTIQDQVNGIIRKSDRLDVKPEMQLGRASINGQDQLITMLGDKKTAGIEVRPGPLYLQADSRMTGNSGSFAATGFAKDMDSLNTTLYLPMGWRLFAASGVDKVSESWLTNWTLLDIFLVLITVLTLYRLLGAPTAGVASLGFILLHPELPALTGLSLFILAAIALLRVVPSGRFHDIVQILRRLGLVIIILTALPFIIDHIRSSIYPQLDWPNYVAGEAGYASGAAAPAPTAAPMPEIAADMAEQSMAKRELRTREAFNMLKAAPPPPPQQLYTNDPDSKVQTGFGISNWRGNGITLQWNGPVDQSQQVSLWLLSPGMNLFLAIVRMLLLAAIIGFLFGVPLKPQKLQELPNQLVRNFVILLALGITLLAPLSAHAEITSYPPDNLLKELKDRMLKEWSRTPECLPDCAAVTRSHLEITANQLTILQEIHTAERTAVPLPARRGGWNPSVILVDGVSEAALKTGDDGTLMVELAPGVHRVQLTGALPDREQVSISFPLTSHYTDAKADGWEVQGIREHGVSDANIQLLRTGAATTTKEPTLEPTALPPFLQVERQLTLGISWNMTTTVRRISPPGEAVVVQVPLIPHETVMSADLPIKNGMAFVNLGPQDYEKSWASQIASMDRLTLAASKDVPWVEIWRVQVSTMWHARFEGTPNVQMEGDTMPVFQPWPGETLNLFVEKPKGAPGENKTIDSTNLRVTAGKRSQNVELNMSLRSSQGGQHDILLPEGAELKQVMVNGALMPLQLKKNQLTLPVIPGTQNFAIRWQQPGGMATKFNMPEIDLGLHSVNATSSLTIPEDRWILLAGGPRLGPAVLFWGLVPMMLLAAFILAKLELTPLRAHHWFLLFLGLSQSSLGINLIVAGWLLALGWRERKPEAKDWMFNVRQVVLGLLTLMAIACVFAGIQHGLLGSPDMKIAGNGSSAYMLTWYQDIAQKILPQGWVISLPLLAYRLMMLAWALWAAISMLLWLQWGWKCFSKDTLWKHSEKKPVPPPPVPSPKPKKEKDA